jgi:hypothetical protein
LVHDDIAARGCRRYQQSCLAYERH